MLKDIQEFLQHSDIDFDIDFQKNYFQIFEALCIIYDIKKETLTEEDLCLKYNLNCYLKTELEKKYLIHNNIKKVNSLKELVLPEQRTPEWFEMRKNKLTASSFAEALGKGHFKGRNESLHDKIIDKPFEPNPITEWGVKYEEVATRFYEFLTGSKIYEFGLIPHPDFPAFGASPDGICDTDSPPEYIGRMLEIKCPPKRKFTKSVPKHYWMQMQGQIEVCDLNECDFFQVKLEEYTNFDEYKNDKNDMDESGFTKNNLPKGCAITYLVNNEPKFHYLYCPLFTSHDNICKWTDIQMKFIEENNYKFHEIKYWYIVRYECTLVLRDKVWWSENVNNIYEYYKDLLYYKKDNNIEILKQKMKEEKSKKPVYHIKESIVDDFCLISDEEDNTNSSS